MKSTATMQTTARTWFLPGLSGREREGGAPHALGPGTAPLPTSSPPVAEESGEQSAPRVHLQDSVSTPARPHPASQRRAFTVTAALLALIGLVLFGQGIWIHAKALLAQVLLDRAFAATLASGDNVKPWSWADTWPVARIEVPRLRQSAIALHSSSGQALAFGPGHVELTPEPGERGTAVYSAHRDTHFAFLGEVKIGDEIRVTRRDGAVARFVVTATSVARFDQSGIDPLAPGRNLVLSTCWPLDAKTAGPLRYLVHAEIVDEAAQ
jgi:sortase A